ncbi:lactate utilization protein B [Streptomyces longispororuber]|uniref:lactate utilization protein B n=1 Tax=Streptomyces longispororuber TaxID=68230 RepID=UPI0033D2A6C2
MSGTFLGMPGPRPRAFPPPGGAPSASARAGFPPPSAAPAFPEAARTAVRDATLRANLRHATHTIRDKRARAVAELDDWAELREAGKRIKDHTLRHLDHYLVRLEEAVTAAGGTVHWAADADEANRVVTRLVKETGEREVVKVKSMATQEIGLNEALEAAGIRAYETDLAELIVQLGRDRPSHILVPAVHRNRGEIRDIFRTEMGRWGRPAPDGLTDAPADLAEAARLHLREKFLRAKVGISGANFMVAETGTLVVVESEGNGRMCLTLPETLISVVGIEKVVPTWRDLEVFLQTLPRSATAERMNPYTSMWTGTSDGPAGEGDGPRAFHLVLLDNGRTDTLADDVGRQVLRCIRCSACLNVCPVYERAGGHAYGSVYPGPIGAVLGPQLRGTRSALDASLPYASSLCGACYDVCPVAIDIPEVLVHLRERVVEGGEVTRRGVRVRLRPARGHAAERAAMRAARWVLGRPGALRAGQRLASRTRGLHPRALPGPGRAWSASRDLPEVPAEPFRDWWRRTRTEAAPAETTRARTGKGGPR